MLVRATPRRCVFVDLKPKKNTKFSVVAPTIVVES
jgi:hypothetical protein